MLYQILYPLTPHWSALNIFQYITFRSSMAAILALLISFIVGPFVIKLLDKHQVGEEIREHGPKSHHLKKGTPTMGGIIILASVLIPTLLFGNLTNIFIQVILLATVWMGLIGFLDDYLKTFKKTKKGLIARYKLAGQILLGVIVSLWLPASGIFGDVWTATSVPFLKNVNLNFGMLYPLAIILVITGTSNAVNLSDGLDGLASGLLAICFSVFAVIAYISGRVDFSGYLNIVYLEGAGELTVFAAAVAGACIGFLWFNSAPAQIFMGDIGSLSMGSALGTMAVLLKKEFLLFIIGGVFVWEAISVLLQLSFFKWTKNRTGTGRRLFRMAPIHHHFELKGWPETKIVIRFWIIGLLLAIFSLTTFKIR